VIRSFWRSRGRLPFSIDFLVNIAILGAVSSGMANQDDLTIAQAALHGDSAAVSAVLDELPYALGVLLSKCTDSDSEEKSREIIDDLPGDLLAGVDRDGKTVKLFEMYQVRAS
jgi:hypothetical protein